MGTDIIEANPKAGLMGSIIGAGAYRIHSFNVVPSYPVLCSASFHALSAMEACSFDLLHEHGEACFGRVREDIAEGNVTDDCRWNFRFRFI